MLSVKQGGIKFHNVTKERKKKKERKKWFILKRGRGLIGEKKQKYEREGESEKIWNVDRRRKYKTETN